MYNNTPLLGFINDNAEEILAISDRCRELGIEFCNIYVAGLPIQDSWNPEHPIDPNSVIDIATTLRRQGSGRQLPRYLVATRLGEVDFSIAPPIFSTTNEGATLVTLRPHDIEYFRPIDPEFTWPDDVQIDDEGHPRIPIEGWNGGCA